MVTHQMAAGNRGRGCSSAEGTPELVSRGSNPGPSVRPKIFPVPHLSHNTDDLSVFKTSTVEVAPLYTHASQMLDSVKVRNPTLNPGSASLVPRSRQPHGHKQWYLSTTPNAATLQDAENISELEHFVQKLQPRLHITEQPKQRGMRFRYKCEGRSAGSIIGDSSTEENKTVPTIELSDCDGIAEVKVITCLVWKDFPYRIHPHSLVGKDCHDGICEITIKPKTNKKHSYNNLGVQCVTKKLIEESVEKKINLGFDPFKAGHWKNQEEVDMNVVRLCFQASYKDHHGHIQQLQPVLSEPIYDKKSTNTSELKICRINKDMGQCSGGEEVYLLCDKVQKEDIAVVFHKESWEAKADFSQADVHRQIAIVFKTPSYQDLDISSPVIVDVYLERITDKVRSDPFSFTYLPKDHDAYGVALKRKQGLPDAIGDLSSSDPHGIEAKRRKKKANYKDHCNSALDAVPLHSCVLAVDSDFPQSNMNQDLSECILGDISDFSDRSGVYFPDWTSSDHTLSTVDLPESFENYFTDCVQPQQLLHFGEFPALNVPMNIDAIQPSTGSLIANSMFPNQYKMEDFEVLPCPELQDMKEPT
ncbi:transcription factor RelB isoform X2 [Ambystoma mexicanum]